MSLWKSPGKLLLMGDHAVVYGQPCIVTALDTYLSVMIEPIVSESIEIVAPGVSNTQFVQAVIQRIEKFKGSKITGIKITTKSEFPSSVGIGSSSAVVVSTARALCHFFHCDLDDESLLELCVASVIDVQKVGSGFDVASAVYGGTILYWPSPRRVERIEGLPEIVIGYSGQKAQTTSLIAAVKQKHDQFPEKVDRIFEAIGKLVKQAVTTLENKEYDRFGKLIGYNQEYLRDLGVSTERLESLIHASLSAGAYGAKLSGAGGGDCMFAVVSAENRPQVEMAIEKSGGVVVRTKTHARGVYENTDNSQEIFTVVDENDVFLKTATRGECHFDKSLIHRSANVLVYDDFGKILLQKRSMTKDTNPGKWTISVSGHVSHPEGYEEAAMREMKEEIGIRGKLEFVEKFLFRYDQESEMEVLFKTVSTGPFYPSLTEVETVRFFTPSEIKQAVSDGSLQLTEFAKVCLSKVGVL